MRNSSIVITTALASALALGSLGAALAQASGGTNTMGTGTSGNTGMNGSRNGDAGTRGSAGNNMSGVQPTPSRTGGDNTGGTETKPTAGAE